MTWGQLKKFMADNKVTDDFVITLMEINSKQEPDDLIINKFTDGQASNDVEVF